MNKDNGGPAFPAPEAAKARFGDSNPDAFLGMTLRDYFAAKAPAVPDDFGWADGEYDLYQRIVRWRYLYADAMLAARAA